jgi:hypothetical protein
MQTYEVGQIVYLLVNGETKVIPVRVIEAITRRTLQGVETTYMVQIPDKGRTVMSLSDLDAEPYSNLDEVKKIMLERVTNSIENTITRTQALANTLMHSPGAETEE